MYPNEVDGSANTVDPDQTALLEQSDLSLHCLLKTFYPKYRTLLIARLPRLLRTLEKIT